MKHILNSLAFFANNKGLQSFSKTCRATRRAIKSLENKGYLKVSWETNQAEFTGKMFN
jgi:hypothetical protein